MHGHAWTKRPSDDEATSKSDERVQKSFCAPDLAITTAVTILAVTTINAAFVEALKSTFRRNIIIVIVVLEAPLLLLLLLPLLVVVRAPRSPSANCSGHVNHELRQRGREALLRERLLDAQLERRE